MVAHTFAGHTVACVVVYRLNIAKHGKTIGNCICRCTAIRRAHIHACTFPNAHHTETHAIVLIAVSLFLHALTLSCMYTPLLLIQHRANASGLESSSCL